MKCNEYYVPSHVILIYIPVAYTSHKGFNSEAKGFMFRKAINV